MTSYGWFSSEVEYQGYGSATFADPPGIIKGPVTISVDETGPEPIEMDIQEVESDYELGEILSGYRRSGVMGFLPGSGNDNTCTELKVSTSEGSFSPMSRIDYWSPFGNGIRFYTLRSRFDTFNASKAKYRVIPLSNFVSDFVEYFSDLTTHPLRLDSRSGVIAFLFAEKPGYIEPLSDFEERKQSLLEQRTLACLTSVMVGEIGPNTIDLDDLENWIPFGFLYLLSLAQGVNVGAAPWIELRDAEGQLVQRVHGNGSLGKPRFTTSSRAAIKEKHHRSIGHLLTKAQSSSYYNKSFLRVAINKVVRASSWDYKIEERLQYLFVALDGLCEGLGLKQPFSLSEDTKQKVKEIVEDAKQSIGAIANELRQLDGNEIAEAEIVDRIKNKLNDIHNVRPNFGDMITNLLAKFDLSDAEILDRFYQENRPHGINSFKKALGKYRGTVMHSGYLNFREDEALVDIIIPLVNHLHDVALRVILKLLNYEGTYRPMVTTVSATTASIDWVKPDTSAKTLGYKPNIS